MTRYEALAEYVRNFATTVETTLDGDEAGEMWAVALREIAVQVVALGQTHAGAVAENERLRQVIMLARDRLDALPISPRLIIARDGLDAALDGGQ